MKPQTDEPQDPPEPQEPLPPLPAPPPTPKPGLKLTGTNGNDLLVGAAHPDEIYGLAGHDSLYGQGGDDRLYGGAGNDWLDGGTGADVLDGGDGQDTVSYFNSTWSAGVLVDLAAGIGARGDAQGDTYVGIEHVNGSLYHDHLFGNAANNSLWGLGGNDTLYGRAGHDHLFGGDGNDVLDGGVGVDMLDGGAGEDWVIHLTSTAGVIVNLATGIGSGGDAQGDTYTNIENVEGTAFADVLTGNASGNKLWGKGGADQLFGGAGNDQLLGGDGNDQLRGGAGADFLDGGAGVDTVNYSDSSVGVAVDLAGNAGFRGDAQGDSYYGIENVIGSNHSDVMDGTAGSNDLIGLGGDDWLRSGDGNDRLFGGEGDDILVGGAGADVLDGGNGNDRVAYTDSGSGVTVNLATGVGFGGEAAGDTYVGIEHVVGSDFNDFIVGDTGNNILHGGAGNDTIIGGAGQDILSGGGGGHDILAGDTNGVVAADLFMIIKGATITDFQQGVDKIRAGNDPSLQDFGNDGELAWGTMDDVHALDASDRYFFDTVSHTLYECDFSSGTLVLGDAIVTINADVPRLQTSDFTFA